MAVRYEITADMSELDKTIARTIRLLPNLSQGAKQLLASLLQPTVTGVETTPFGDITVRVAMGKEYCAALRALEAAEKN